MRSYEVHPPHLCLMPLMRWITGFMSFEIKPLFGERRIAGPAVTTKDALSRIAEPPLLALKAIDSAERGDVIARTADGDSRNIGLWGGLMATASKQRGIEAVAVDGGIRDVAEMTKLQLPIFARSVVPSTSIRRTEVLATNIPVVCGGVEVNLGDIVVGDCDGVVVTPIQHVTQVLKRAEEIDRIENLEAEDLRRGAGFVATVNSSADSSRHSVSRVLPE